MNRPVPHPSTFSIVAYDPSGPAWGIAVASKFLAVGALVPFAQAGAGAIATQSYANTAYGPQGLALLAAGHSAEETLKVLISNDPLADRRQVGLVDLEGRSATYTGSGCHAWSGGISGPGYAIQGNILAGQQVVEQMQAAYTSTEKALVWRLYRALKAGDAAGGDRRGRQSAALLVVKPQGGYGGGTDRWIDLRVDDHPDPVARLGELLELHDLYFGQSDPASQLSLHGETLERLQRLLIQQGYWQGQVGADWDASQRQAAETFIGTENFEERVDFERAVIDRPVLEYLERHFGVKHD